MSFCFPSWSTAFSPAFHEDAKAMLEGALNKGNKPPVIQGHIEVVELSMGKEPPTLTLLEIGDLSLDRFRGILRLGYSGDAFMEVRCRVQANPLSHNPNLLSSSTLPLSTPLLASQPLLVPMTLRLSRLHLRAILILVVSASKGITLVFKNDPLQNVDVSSTFDSVEVIRGYLQQEIEGQLREMFREDLPGIIHRLSQRWFTGTGVGGKVEMPYKEEPAAISGRPDEDDDELDPNDPYAEKEIFPAYTPAPASPPSAHLTPRRRALQKAARDRRLSTSASESPTSYTIFPDIEDYDPTYGLRPEGLPTHSGYEAFGRLWEKAREGEGRGLGGLMARHPVSGEVDEEDRGDVSDSWDEDEVGDIRSFDMVEMEESLRPIGRPSLSRAASGRRSVVGTNYEDDNAVEWETFPAVGGGVITRPRIYHSQSQIRAPSEAGRSIAMPSPSGTGSVTARASSIGGASSTIGSSMMRSPDLPQSSGSKAFPQFRPAAGPGPSSLRRLVTSRSDVFSANHHPTRSESYANLPSAVSSKTQPFPGSALSRRQSTNAASSATRTSSSWETDKGPSRSNTMSTLASSQLPSSKSMSIDSKARRVSSTSHHRAPSFAGTSQGNSFPPRSYGPGGIMLPLNNSVSQLATLSHSNHTLSPYARGHEHIAVRSFPHLGKTGLAAHANPSGYTTSQNQPRAVQDGTPQVRARRKRIYHLGKNPDKAVPPLSPDVDDVSPSRESPPSQKTLSDEYEPSQARHRQATNASLTGVAQQVMQHRRPNYGRAPDSRTSYGFPPSSRSLRDFGRITEE